MTKRNSVGFVGADPGELVRTSALVLVGAKRAAPCFQPTKIRMVVYYVCAHSLSLMVNLHNKNRYICSSKCTFPMSISALSWRVHCTENPSSRPRHWLRSHPDGERFSCHATGSSHKGTTGGLREALPEGNIGVSLPLPP